jgi:hypothetical protein
MYGHIRRHRYFYPKERAMGSPPTEDVRAKALRLLKEIKTATEYSEQPVFIDELAPRLGMSEAEARGAFRYLAGKHWIDTFDIPYTGRINAAGHDAVLAADPGPSKKQTDRDAEVAVRQAVEELVGSGKRAYSLSVPFAAESMLVRMGKGRVSSADANSRIRPAIIAMVERGELEAYAEGHKDWLLRDPAASENEKPDAARSRDEIMPKDDTSPLNTTEWDVFISHASEDKDGFVRPLAEKLRSEGLRVWYDEFTLVVGDSLRRSIDRGLAKSRFGVVVVSQAFLQKEWPQRELDGLVAREINGVKVILPVWHNIGHAEICTYSPTLADRMAVSSSKGIEHVAAELIRAIRRDDPNPRNEARAKESSEVVPIVRASKSLETDFRPLLAYARKLHGDGVGKIVSGKSPVAILGGAALVVHVVPLSATHEASPEVFDKICRSSDSFPPIGDNRGRDSKVSFDGLLIGSHSEGLAKPQRAFVHVSRSGAIEVVVSSLGRGHEHNFLMLPQIQSMLIKYVAIYTRSLNACGIAPPAVICASLVGVANMRLLTDFISNALPEDIPGELLSRSQFTFAESILDAVPTNYIDCAKQLKATLDHLANAAGLTASPYFDPDGNYTLTP